MGRRRRRWLSTTRPRCGDEWGGPLFEGRRGDETGVGDPQLGFMLGHVASSQPVPPDMLRVQAERQAALAAELGGGALLEECAQLQADLMTCQQVGSWLAMTT